MSITKKIEAVAAFRLEMGKGIGATIPSWSFGGNTVSALAAGHLIPILSAQHKGTVETFTDESIEGKAFRDLPVLSGKSAPVEGIEINMRYEGMDRLLYWALGYEDGGSSPQSLGGGYYSHLFELDRHEREDAPYRADEQTAGDYSQYDRKNRFAVFARKMGTNDYRYPFLLCSSFAFSSAAQESLKMTVGGVALREDRGDYGSSSWTPASLVAGSSKLIMHHHLTLSMGIAGSLVEIGVKDLNVSGEIPLFIDRDSESGLLIAKPVMSGAYNVTISFTIARHSVDTYLKYRDDFQKCALKAEYESGDNLFGIYIPEGYLTEASVNEDDVARQPITFTTGKPSTNPFTTEIGDHDLIQNGSIFIMTKNTNSVNEMRRE